VVSDRVRGASGLLADFGRRLRSSVVCFHRKCGAELPIPAQLDGLDAHITVADCIDICWPRTAAGDRSRRTLNRANCVESPGSRAMMPVSDWNNRNQYNGRDGIDFSDRPFVVRTSSMAAAKADAREATVTQQRKDSQGCCARRALALMPGSHSFWTSRPRS